MATTHEPSRKVHHGRNVRRFREVMGLKQEAFASLLGDEWNQKRVSVLEAKEAIDESVLDAVAKVLNVSADVIRNFDEETVIYKIQNNYDHSVNHQNYKPVITQGEAVSEIRRLYEALLKSEREKADLLQKLLDAK